ncbi:MAG TPA: thioesterase domain-containing protein [Candidatus Hydrogenedentes bacterium]|nr:thioesterase domain-containing protein [Candidatus Hydrogenedentota bacterium]
MIPHLFALHPDGVKPPFFLCAPAGGVLFPCYHVLKYWDRDRPFYGIQDPSLNKDTPYFRSVEDLARANIEVMKTKQPKGPYIIGGWSFGAMVALDMARQLAATGEKAEIVVLDMRVNGPGRESPIANLSALQKCWVIPKLLVAVFSHTGPYFRDGFYVMFGDRIKRGSILAPLLRVCMRLLGRAPIADVIEERPYLDTVQPPGLFRCLRVLGANMRAFRKYKPAPIDAHGSLIKASDSASLGLHDPDPAMGWGDILRGGIDIYDTPGNHVTLMLHPAIEVVGESMRMALERADSVACVETVA